MFRASIARHGGLNVLAALPKRLEGERFMADDKTERARRSKPPWRRSRSSSARARSCGSAAARRSTSPPSPPGSLSLDLALGVGGMPRGRVVEIFGPESSGKTTLALHVIAEAQKRGGMAAFIDAEHALDAVYAGKLGVDIDNLLVSQPDSGEQALEIAEMLVRSDAVDVIVDRLGGRPRPPRRDRGRDGRRADGPAGPPDEPGPAQAHRPSSPRARPASSSSTSSARRSA